MLPVSQVERTWLDGWLLRAGRGVTLCANSAVPLDISAHAGTIPAIAAWYEQRGLTPWLAIPDRLLRLPPGLAGEHGLISLAILIFGRQILSLSRP